MTERRPFDAEAYMRAVRQRPCFICGLVAGDPAFAHHVVYEDDETIAFLNKWPTLTGYVLVCPKVHREQVAGDFTPTEYLRLQTVVYAVAEAVRAVLPTERIYVASLGSQQGNRHVHWHVAALPPGVPFAEQQLAALNAERAGVLTIDDAEMAALARRIAAEIRVLG